MKMGQAELNWVTQERAVPQRVCHGHFEVLHVFFSFFIE